MWYNHKKEIIMFADRPFLKKYPEDGEKLLWTGRPAVLAGHWGVMLGLWALFSLPLMAKGGFGHRYALTD